MKIQVWSDFRCPFCYIGKRNLENAVKKSNKDIEIELMSYELNPNFEPIEGEGTYVQKLSKTLGISETKVTEALTSDDIAYQVRSNQQHAQNIGVQGVPHFLIDNKVFVSGAQPVDTFLEAIEYVESLDK